MWHPWRKARVWSGDRLLKTLVWKGSVDNDSRQVGWRSPRKAETSRKAWLTEEPRKPPDYPSHTHTLMRSPSNVTDIGVG